MKRKKFIIFVFSLLTLNQVNQVNYINKLETNNKTITNLYNEKQSNYNKEVEKNKKLKEENNLLIIKLNELKKENLQLQNEIDKLKKEKENNKYITKNVIVSYYTNLPEEGGGLGITASGKKLSNKSLAIPRNDNLLKFGMEIEFDSLAPQYMKDYNGKYLKRIADDTGNPKYIKKIDNNTYKLDVYCPKLPNESNSEYKKRVTSYGITKTKIKIKL